jgi:hypothetical protein
MGYRKRCSTEKENSTGEQVKQPSVRKQSVYSPKGLRVQEMQV